MTCGLIDMRGSEDPKPQFAYLVQQLLDRFPSLAFIHVVEPRVQGNEDRPVEDGEVRHISLCFLSFAFA